MRIIPLSEGSFTIDKTKQFVPFNVQEDNLQSRPVGSLLVEIQPFVVITSEDIILIDTGLGFEQDGVLQLHRNLMQAGINPSEVTKVLMSHLHKDHAGGMTRPSSEQPGVRLLSFPQATYYIQRAEMEFAFEKNFPSYITTDFDLLRTASNVHWLEGDGVIDGYIKYEVTGAHSRYHQIFRIVDGGETAFFGGDVAPQLQQMKSRFVAKYDEDGKKCMEYRQQWWEQGQREGWHFLFYHDIKTPVFPGI